ncbi:MAG: sulfite exporter TauE/SafE family protein [Tetrasphaera sp.]|nr:sulfite exporter TauE/SafE family protein [Tetrasphaera sp.]
MTVGWGLVLLLGCVVALGALVQGTVGFGVAVVAAPVTVILAPSLMPAAVLMAGFTLAAVQVSAGRSQIDWRMFGWSMSARMLATPLGVAVVAWWSARVIAVAVGVLLLVTVALSVWAFDIGNTPRSAVIAGLISGVAGTAASIGGPFLAMVLRNEPPERARGTLGATFVLGSLTSLAGLAFAGELQRDQLIAGAVWAPFVILGYVAAAPLRARIDADRFRRWVLLFCVVAAVGVLARAAVA